MKIMKNFKVCKFTRMEYTRRYKKALHADLVEMSWLKKKHFWGQVGFWKGSEFFGKRFIAERKFLLSFKYKISTIVDYFNNAPEIKLGQAFAPRQFGRKLQVLKDFPIEKFWWKKKFLLTPLWKFHNGVIKIHNGVMKFITALWKSCHNVAARPRELYPGFKKLGLRGSDL